MFQQHTRGRCSGLGARAWRGIIRPNVLEIIIYIGNYYGNYYLHRKSLLPAADAVAWGQEGVEGNHQSVRLAVTAVFSMKIILHAYPVTNFQKVSCLVYLLYLAIWS